MHLVKAGRFQGCIRLDLKLQCILYLLTSFNILLPVLKMHLEKVVKEFYTGWRYYI